MNINNLGINEKFTVIKINTEGEIRQRIIEMGFTPGSKGIVIRKAPLGDPIEISIMNYEISLRSSEAASIEVVKGHIELEGEDITGKDMLHPVSLKNEYTGDKKRNSSVVNVAFIGNPNAGKTTIFNSFTGLNYRVANYPGVTVEKKEARVVHKGVTYNLVDLPGIYSLSPYSEDEVIACNYLLNENPDLIINVVDATNIERNLYLTMQLRELGIPMITVLNMYENAEKKGVDIDEKQLSLLFKFPVIKVLGSNKESVFSIFDNVQSAYNANYKDGCVFYGSEIENAISYISSNIENTEPSKRRFLAIKLLEKDERIEKLISKTYKNSSDILADYKTAQKKLEVKLDKKTDVSIAEKRYSYIRGALRECVSKRRIEVFNFTDAADIVFLNKFIGLPIFIAILWLIFQATFVFGAYPMDLLDSGISLFSGFIYSLLPDNFLRSLIVDGIIAGVGSVISFLPPILILFVGISFLEDTGYMARAAFLMDKIMHKLGLHGQSFIPLFMGFGCTVPAIIAARTLRSKKDRIVTILITTLMSCGARLPVYTLIIGTFFSASLAPNILLSIYLIGIVIAFIMAFLFRKLLFKGDETPFVMELPPYRMPRLITILRHMLDRIFAYLKRAATFILLASIVMWFLFQYPSFEPSETESESIKLSAIENLKTRDIEINDETLENEYSILLNSEAIKHSYAGSIGRFIEPAIKPIGFDWRVGISLLAGMSAKEVLVSTIATIKGIEGGDNTSLKEVLRNDDFLDPIKAYSLLLFVLLYTPCLAAVMAIGQEIGKKWMWLTVVYTLGLAWIVSFIFYNSAMFIKSIV